MTPFTALSFKVVFFVIGTAFGSFLNVVALRYNGEGRVFNLAKISGRSRCPRCRRALVWYELVPLLSFILQLRKCRHCGRRISWQYPLVELAGGFALLLPFYFDNLYVGIIWTLAALAMILLAIIDWRLQIIPDPINLFLAGLGVVLIFLTQESLLRNYTGVFQLSADTLTNHFLAGAIAFLFFGLIIALSRGRAMGMGDMKMAGALGLLTGWPDIILVVALSFIVGAVWGLFLLATKRKRLKEAVPFGPFLVIGTFITMFFGYQLMNWYFMLF